jgi:hypothetical protein
MDRIIVIRKSLTAFVCGIIGFLPFIGCIPAIYALICWAQIRLKHGYEWNPASVYLNWGVWLAVLGLLGSGVIVVAAVAAIALNA